MAHYCTVVSALGDGAWIHAPGGDLKVNRNATEHRGGKAPAARESGAPGEEAPRVPPKREETKREDSERRLREKTKREEAKREEAKRED